MQPEIVVAGHVCLDVIPAFSRQASLDPGALLEVGGVSLSTGGAVSNTGGALHRLGFKTRLVGKVGDDLFGRAIQDLLKDAGAGGMVVEKGGNSSYSIVISQPGRDRTFLHCPGVNDTFCADDVTEESLRGARLIHFGYPTLMRRMYSDGGREVEAIFSKARRCGLKTSLDMSLPDPDSDAGRVDWRAWLERVLPLVDIFLPSLDETQRMIGDHSPAELMDMLKDMGAGIVGLKMGKRGMCALWDGRIYESKCFDVPVVGTTGTGDCTIAGFLGAYVRGLDPQGVLDMACAVGACCCEAADATSGIRTWDETRVRIDAGWPRME